MNQQRILVVDSEENVAHLIASALRSEGFDIRLADNSQRALIAIAEYQPDLMILDTTPRGSAPDEPDGFDALRRSRIDGAVVPAVFLIASDAEINRLASLRAGMNDYLIKPFSLEELLDRVHAVLRRVSLGVRARASILKVGDLELDEDSREVRRGDREIHLTSTEFELLRLLMRNERVVLSKPVILERVWNYDFQGSTNIVETYISYLRKKVDTGESKLIHTIRGVGYVLKAPHPAATRTPVIPEMRRPTEWADPRPEALESY